MKTNNWTFEHQGWIGFFLSSFAGAYFFLILTAFMSSLFMIPMFVLAGAFALGIGAYNTSSVVAISRQKDNEDKMRVVTEYFSMPKELRKEYGPLDFDVLKSMRDDQARVLYDNIQLAHTKYRLAQQEIAKPAIDETIRHSDDFRQLQENRLFAYKELG